jgi:hypothetical protein
MVLKLNLVFNPRQGLGHGSKDGPEFLIGSVQINSSSIFSYNADRSKPQIDQVSSSVYKIQNKINYRVRFKSHQT